MNTLQYARNTFNISQIGKLYPFKTTHRDIYRSQFHPIVYVIRSKLRRNKSINVIKLYAIPCIVLEGFGLRSRIFNAILRIQ